MTFLGHIKYRNDVIHQFCGLRDFKIAENSDILPGKICNTPKIFFKCWPHDYCSWKYDCQTFVLSGVVKSSFNKTSHLKIQKALKICHQICFAKKTFLVWRIVHRTNRDISQFHFKQVNTFDQTYVVALQIQWRINECSHRIHKLNHCLGLYITN